MPIENGAQPEKAEGDEDRGLRFGLDRHGQGARSTAHDVRAA